MLLEKYYLPAEIAVELEDASFGWDSTSAEFLKNINLSVKKGELVAIVGKVGSGKSSVLSALLGEKKIIFLPEYWRIS